MLTQDNQSKNQPQSLNAKDVNGQTKPVPLEDLLEDLTSNPQPDKQKKWRSLSLRTKATLLAVLLSTVPVVVIGGAAYYFSSRSLIERIRETEKQKTSAIADKINRFMYERYGDIQVLATHPLLANRKVQAVMPQTDRENVLNEYAKAYGVYTLIAFADLDGTTPIRSTITQDPASSIKERDFFKTPLSTGKPFISQPGLSTVYLLLLRKLTPIN
jgi:methyl-accepting chemotaxis protein PixJ